MLTENFFQKQTINLHGPAKKQIGSLFDFIIQSYLKLVDARDTIKSQVSTNVQEEQ